MTFDEFKNQFHKLWTEFDPNLEKEFLLAICEFKEDDQTPDNISILGNGCPSCMVEGLIELEDRGEFGHKDSGRKETKH
jgi:hypothetical protein